MYKLLSSLALVAAFAMPGALHASTMSGQFSIQGTVTNDPTTHTLSFLPPTIETGFGTQTGTFATLLTDNEHVPAGTATIAYGPYVPGSGFFMVGPLSAVIQSLSESTSIIGGHTVYGFYGVADFSAAGYDPTSGSFTFSTQDSGPVTFSATAVMTGASQVPEPSSLALLGTGAFGLAGIVSRKLRT
ncbi:MAG: PEP-CTERM sorting domain-containing protein [Edaphobacter sp.]